MNKKKAAAVAVSLALVAVIGIGATLSYFTDKTNTKTNIVTMGKVDIDLSETSPETDGAKPGEVGEEGISFPDVMPGDNLSKIPTVTVAEDSQPAYIRVKLNAELNDILAGAGINEDMVFGWLDIDQTKWVKGAGDYFYYQEIAEPKAALDIFTTVAVPGGLGNKVAGGSFTIKIQAEAIQAANVEPERTAGRITGWPAADIEELK